MVCFFFWDLFYEKTFFSFLMVPFGAKFFLAESFEEFSKTWF